MNYLQKLLLFVHFIFHGISRHVLPSSLELYPCGARARFRSVARAFWFHRPLPVLRSLQRERGKREFIYCFFFFQPVSFSGSVLNFQNCIWGGGADLPRLSHHTLGAGEGGRRVFSTQKERFQQKTKSAKKRKKLHLDLVLLFFLFYIQPLFRSLDSPFTPLLPSCELRRRATNPSSFPSGSAQEKRRASQREGKPRRCCFPSLPPPSRPRPSPARLRSRRPRRALPLLSPRASRAPGTLLLRGFGLRFGVFVVSGEN